MATFAVAALVVAIVFADRLVAPDDLRKRFYQVGFGVAIALLVAAIAAAVVPVPEEQLGQLGLGQPDEDATGVLRERLSVVTGGAFLLLLAGLYQWRAYPTLCLGVVLGGLILMIGAVADAGSGGFVSFYYELTLDGGETRNAVYGAIIAIGTALLLLYGFNEWERYEEEPAEAA
jgi:hypothetical protein